MNLRRSICVLVDVRVEDARISERVLERCESWRSVVMRDCDIWREIRIAVSFELFGWLV